MSHFSLHPTLKIVIITISETIFVIYFESRWEISNTWARDAWLKQGRLGSKSLLSLLRMSFLFFFLLSQVGLL